jgi:hypothetical protein
MSTPVWRKSSRSSGEVNTDCVEVAKLPAAIGVRDSKDPSGPRLALSDRTFAHLVGRVKANQLDL